MATKIIETEVTVCDFEHGEDVIASHKTVDGKDVCTEHNKEFEKRIFLPESLGGNKSTYSIAVDPKYKKAVFKIKGIK